MQALSNPLEIIFLVIALVMSVVIHEVSHGFAAYFLGDPTAKNAGRLTINPLRHLDLVGSFIVPVTLLLLGGFVIGWAKPVPYDPSRLSNKRWGPAIVAAAGPVANILLVIIFSLVLRLAPWFDVSANFTGLVALIVLINLSLALFNLLPVPPLDGSKILLAIFFDSSRRVENWLNRYQLVLFVLLLILILNTNFLSQFISTIFHFLVG